MIWRIWNCKKTKYGIRKNKMQELLNDLFIKVDNRYYGAKRKLDSARVYSVKNQQDSRFSRQEHANEAVKSLIEFSEYLDSVQREEPWKSLTAEEPWKKLTATEEKTRREHLSEIAQTNHSLISMWQRRDLCINYHVASPVISNKLAKQVLDELVKIDIIRNNRSDVKEMVEKVFFHAGLLCGSEAFRKEKRFKEMNKHRKFRDDNSSLLRPTRVVQNRSMFRPRTIKTPSSIHYKPKRHLPDDDFTSSSNPFQTPAKKRNYSLVSQTPKTPLIQGRDPFDGSPSFGESTPFEGSTSFGGREIYTQDGQNQFNTRKRLFAVDEDVSEDST